MAESNDSTEVTKVTESGGDIIKQGSLEEKQSFIGFKERWTVLQSHSEGSDYYSFRYESKEDHAESASSIKIDGATEIAVFTDDTDHNDLMFYVENEKENKKFIFKAASKELRDEWIDIITDRIKSIKSNNKNEDMGEQDELSKWLKKYGFTKYESALRESEVEYDMIQLMEDEDAKELAEMIGIKGFKVKLFVKAVMHVRTADSKEVDAETEKLRKQRAGNEGWVRRRQDIPSFGNGKHTKSVIFIGQTGAGKTTLINSMTNYLEKVAYEEPFRYKLIMESKDDGIEEKKSKSQTREIISYHLKDVAAVDYSLNIIDTPGFGDTQGPEQDMKIRAMFRDFFKTIDAIDAIYFVVKSSDTRLDATQSYIFDMVLNVFGKDVKDNIFMLFTFADGALPPVLEVVKEVEVFKNQMPKHFKINNSGFGLRSEHDDPIQKSYFNLGNEQFKLIFDALASTKSKSIANSLRTLEERDRITLWLSNISEAVKTAMDKQTAARQVHEYLLANKDKADANEDFKYPDQVVEVHEDPLPHGRYTTTCPKCATTCHKTCGIKDDAKKYGCWAMKDGFCTQCDKKCKWDEHFNKPYIIRRETKIVYKTKQAMADKYKLAQTEMVKCTDIITAIKTEMDVLEKKICATIEKMRDSVNTLSKIALNDNVLTTDDYFDTLITAEETDRNGNWEERVKQLRSMKENNQLLKEIVEAKKAPSILSTVKNDNFDKMHRQSLSITESIDRKKLSIDVNDAGNQKKGWKIGINLGKYHLGLTLG